MPLIKSPDAETLRVYVRPLQATWSMQKSELVHHPLTVKSEPALPITIMGGLHLRSEGQRDRAVLSAFAPKALGSMESDAMRNFYTRHFGIGVNTDRRFNMATLTLSGVGKPLRLLTASGLFDAPVMAGLPESVQTIFGGLLVIPERYWSHIGKRGLVVSDTFGGGSEQSIAIPTLELARRSLAPSVTGWWKELLGFTPRSLVTVRTGHIGEKRMASIMRNFRPIGVVVT